jgi:hypothetical protein
MRRRNLLDGMAAREVEREMPHGEEFRQWIRRHCISRRKTPESENPAIDSPLVQSRTLLWAIQGPGQAVHSWGSPDVKENVDLRTRQAK